MGYTIGEIGKIDYSGTTPDLLYVNQGGLVKEVVKQNDKCTDIWKSVALWPGSENWHHIPSSVASKHDAQVLKIKANNSEVKGLVPTKVEIEKPTLEKRGEGCESLRKLETGELTCEAQSLLNCLKDSRYKFGEGTFSVTWNEMPLVLSDKHKLYLEILKIQTAAQNVMDKAEAALLEIFHHMTVFKSQEENANVYKLLETSSRTDYKLRTVLKYFDEFLAAKEQRLKIPAEGSVQRPVVEMKKSKATDPNVREEFVKKLENENFLIKVRDFGKLEWYASLSDPRKINLFNEFERMDEVAARIFRIADEFIKELE